MTWDREKVLPLPVTPSRTWSFNPFSRPSDSAAMALGWSPVGSKGATSLKSGISRSVYQPEHESNGCSLPRERRVEGCVRLVPRLVRRPGRLEDACRDRPNALHEPALRRDPLVGGLGGRATADQPFALDAPIAGHEPDLVADLGKAALDETDRLDDHGRGAVTRGAVDRCPDARPNGGVRDRLEVAERDRIGEHDPPERLPVERPVVTQDRLAEPLDDRLESRLSRLDDITCHLVGVDADDARSLPEPSRDGRLSAPDRPGQPDQHGHGRRSSSSSHASSAAANATSISANSLVTRPSSTKFACTDGSPSASSR